MQYLSTADVAEKLEVSEQYVRKLLRDDKISGQRIGSTWMVCEEEATYFKSKAQQQDIADQRCQAVRVVDKPIVLSFFSGALGLDLGLEAAGFQTILACENDKHSRQTIMANKPDIGLLGDVSEISVNDVFDAAGLNPGDDIDLIAGGPPCQAFSSAGKRKGFDDDRGNVFLDFVKLALELNPKYLVLENVRGLLSAPMKHIPHSDRADGYGLELPDEVAGGALAKVLAMIRSAGYGVSFNLYNSANFGVPQIRERVILACSRDGRELPYLFPTHSQIDDNLQPWVTFKEAVTGINEHDHLNFPEKRLKYYRQLGPGQYWKHLPIEMQKEALGKSFYSGGGKTGFFRRIHWDKPAPTLVTHPAMPATDLGHPSSDRPLSVQEYKRIQQFPDNYVVCGKILSQYKQLGNAVPVGLGKAVGELIIRDIEGRSESPDVGFKFSRYRNTNHKEWQAEFSRKTEALVSKQSDMFKAA